MQLIGIVLLLLVGLSGSKDVLGKKCAWLPLYLQSIWSDVSGNRVES
jgi:hypothetical protein